MPEAVRRRQSGERQPRQAAPGRHSREREPEATRWIWSGERELIVGNQWHQSAERDRSEPTRWHQPDTASPARQTFRPALRSIPFWSCYIYSPRGSGYASELSRQLCTRLKLVDPAWLPAYAAQVQEQASRNPQWVRLFERSAVLVPVPGSSVPPGPLWAAERLACALCGIGLAGSVWTGLHRVHAVRKSATALNVDRPAVKQHYDSFAIATELPDSTRTQRIILIDDVITKGRTLFAAALRLHEALPSADVRAFALVRTMGFLSNILHSLEPCQGVIRWAAGDVYREP